MISISIWGVSSDFNFAELVKTGLHLLVNNKELLSLFLDFKGACIVSLLVSDLGKVNGGSEFLNFLDVLLFLIILHYCDTG